MSVIGEVRIEKVEVYRPSRLAEVVEALRIKRGMSRSDLARASGIMWATVENIEQGLQDPRASTLDKLFEALGVDLQLVERPAAPEPAGEGQE